MKKKTLLLALIPALLLAPSCSPTKNTGGMKANDAVIKNETTNDKYGDSPVMLKADRHNVVNTAAADDVAVSTTEEGDNLILSFAVSEALATELIATGNNEVSVYYGYVPYEYDAVDNATVLARGEKIDYDLSLGRVIRLIIKDRGTADYADKKYQGVLVYERNSTEYVSETQSISQTWETVEEDITDNLLAHYNTTLTVETDNQYDGKKTYKMVSKKLTGSAVYSHANLTTPTVQENYSGAKLSFVLKTSNVASSSVFIRPVDSGYSKLTGVTDANCKPTSTTPGVVCEALEDDWYKYTVDYSVAFASLQTNQMLPAAATQLVFSNADTSENATVYISDITLIRQDKANLPAPSITLTGATITWENINHASSYTVYKDGVEQGTYERTDVLTYTDTDETVGVHKIKVVAHVDNTGYFYDSSATVIHKITNEAAEETDFSNNLISWGNSAITRNDDAFYNGAYSQTVTGTGVNVGIALPVSCLGGITGKTLTFHTQVLETSAAYLHVYVAYYNTSGTRISSQGVNYIPVTNIHDPNLGTSVVIEGTNWVRSTFALDDTKIATKGGNAIDLAQVAGIQLIISEQCTFNIDAMTVTDTPTA